jgi:hypothetical protein
VVLASREVARQLADDAFPAECVAKLDCFLRLGLGYEFSPTIGAALH